MPLSYSRIIAKEVDVTGNTAKSRFKFQVSRLRSTYCESCKIICSVLRFSIGFKS